VNGTNRPSEYLTEREARTIAADLNKTEERIPVAERWSARAEEDETETRPDRWYVQEYNERGDPIP
jgi:hypothetical protein